MIKITKKQISSYIGLTKAIAKILDDKKAEKITVINVEKQTSLCRYFVIASGLSRPHVDSLADELDEILADAGCPPLHKDSADGWCVRDYGSVIVHVFDRQNREFYNLEKLWRDGKMLDVGELLRD